jgi:hypothetical protein
MGRLEAGSNMNMIYRASDFFGHSTHTPNDAAQVGVESICPAFFNPTTPSFGAEHEMIMQTHMCCRHIADSSGYYY